MFGATVNSASSSRRSPHHTSGLFGGGSPSSGMPVRSSAPPHSGLFGGSLPPSAESVGLLLNDRPLGNYLAPLPRTVPLNTDGPATCTHKDLAETKLACPDVRVAKTEAVEFGSEIITVTVGGGELQRSFVVHRALIWNRTCGFGEHADYKKHEAILLPDVDADVFDLYLQHLYTQKLPSKQGKPGTTTPADHSIEITLLCKFFALAQKLRDDLATKDAINAIYGKAHEQPGLNSLLPNNDDVAIIYGATSESCGARRLMVDLYMWKAASQLLSREPPYTPDFTRDLAMKLLDQQKSHSKEIRLKKEVSEYYDRA